MATPIINDFEQTDRVGYFSNPQKQSNTSSGFMPLDQLLSNLPSFETQTNPSGAAPTQTQPTPEPDIEKRREQILREITFNSMNEKLEEVKESKTLIGGIDQLVFQSNPSLRTKPAEDTHKTDLPQPQKLSSGEISFSKVVKETAVEQSKKAGKKLFKGSKEVWKATFELKDLIFFKHKSKEQLKKEAPQKEKEAKKAAIKSSFFERLRSAVFEHQNKKMKARMENKKRLDIAGLAPEQANQLLGQGRNTSFEDLESEYHDEQTALGIFYKREAEKKAKAQAAAKAPGGSLSDQFSQARFAGERSGGHNAQSAAG